MILEDSNRNKVARLLLALIGKKKSPYGSYIHDIFFIDSQANYPEPDPSTAMSIGSDATSAT